MDAASRAVLQDLYLREGRSLMQYASEAFPWAAHEYRDRLALVPALAREEQQALARVVRALARQHVMPPPLGVYPEHYMDLNFLALDRFLSELIADQKARVRQLEATVPHVPDEAARELVRGYLEIKLRHALQLAAALGQDQPPAAPAPAPA